MSNVNLAVLTDEQHATILAALRFYQREGMGDLSSRSKEIHDIATIAGEVNSLDCGGISELCEQLNCEQPESKVVLHALMQNGMEFGECVNVFGVASENDPYVRYASENDSEGNFEVDGISVVSKGDEPGAYVMGWLWVSDYDCGVRNDQATSD